MQDSTTKLIQRNFRQRGSEGAETVRPFFTITVGHCYVFDRPDMSVPGYLLTGYDPLRPDLLSFINMRISKKDEPVNSELKNIKLSSH